MKTLSYGRQDINDEDIQAVVDVLKGDWLTMGPKVAEFEEALASYAGVKHAVTFSSGTSALHGAMFATGMGAGDCALTTPLTFIATSNAIAYTGATPLFADIDPDTFCLSPERAQEVISTGHKLKAIVPVSFAGYPVDLKPFREIADKSGAYLIEDASHSLGGERNGQKIGAQADMTTLSFHPVKHITTAEGGAVLTDNDELAKKLKMFRNHGQTRDKNEFVDEPAGPWHAEMQFLGYNYRLSEISCALGLSQLKRLDDFVATRRKIASRYRELLDGVASIELPPHKDGHAYHLFVLRTEPEKHRELFEYLCERNIRPQVHYSPVPLNPYYRKTFGYKAGDFPEAEKYYNRAMSLPIFTRMNDDDVDRVAEAIKDFASK